MHAFLHIDTDGALAAAKNVDAKRAAGEQLGPLAGVPLALKDVLTMNGVPTTCGSKILEGWRPPYDSTVVRKLREADVVIRRQDQHGRVRDGVVDRKLRVRRHPQPVGSRRESPAVRRVGRVPRLPGSRHRSRSAPTPAARSANPLRSPASSA